MSEGGTIYTIGHSTHDLTTFLGLLRKHSITAVADVRSQPYSRLDHFCQGTLKAELGAVGIDYVFLGRELGARREEAECYVNGQAVYDRLAMLPAFEAGLQRLESGAERHVIAVMCAEKDALDCHRMVLVARQLARRGNSIQHILADGQLESQRAAELRLVRKLGIERTLFEPDLTQDDLVERAYEERARQIAYTIEHEGV